MAWTLPFAADALSWLRMKLLIIFVNLGGTLSEIDREASQSYCSDLSPQDQPTIV